jgi:phosphatidate cytidylyltransferase
MTINFLSEFFKRSITSCALLICVGGAYIHSSTLFSLLLAAIFIIILLFEWPKLVSTDPILLFIIITLLYPILPMFCLMYLHCAYRQQNILIPLYPFFIAWSYDTCGYLVGKVFGKHKVCPLISPGKSWEGLGGGFLGIILVNIFFLQRIDPNILIGSINGFNKESFARYTYSFLLIIIISMLFTFLAFAGGMLISYLKRKKNLKDTGSILPGHGGFLDRFDSVFFIAIAVLIGVLIHFK